MNPITQNAIHLKMEYEWLSALINQRIKNYFSGDPSSPQPNLLPPSLKGGGSSYARIVSQDGFAPAQRIILLLALAPVIMPQVLDPFLAVKRKSGRVITEFGGIPNRTSHAFIPTAETALFLIAGADLKKRMESIPLLTFENQLFAQSFLEIKGVGPGESFLNGILYPSRELVQTCISERPFRPDFGQNFPAKLISTHLEWEDLVLEENTVNGIKDLKDWVIYSKLIMEDWGMKKRLKPGFKALFYGPPGTGKTLTASLLGKYTQKDVYRIDLSMVVSKYIGETEKNLEKVFSKAENKGWILFFDEADALFGKRTQVKDSHDRFANQEVSYLLQRVEEFDGLVILCSNNKDNIDDAFSRRFQSIIHFPMPKSPERLRLWQTNLPKALPLDPAIDLKKVANQYAISGGSMMNAIRFCALRAAQKEVPSISQKDLFNGIRREMIKNGKII